MLGWLIYVWIDIGVTITQVVLHALGNPSQLYGQHMSLPTFILNQFVNLDQIQYIRDMYNAHYSIYNMFIHMIYKDYLEWVTFSLENIASSKVIISSFPSPFPPTHTNCCKKTGSRSYESQGRRASSLSNLFGGWKSPSRCLVGDVTVWEVCVWCSSDGAICCSDLFNLKSNGDVFIIQGCYKL